MGWVEVAFVVLVFFVAFLGRRGSAPKMPTAGGAEGNAPRPEALTLGSLLTAWQEAMVAARQQAEGAEEAGELSEPQMPARALPPVLPMRREGAAVLPAVMAAPAALVKRAPVEVATVDREAEHARFHERIAPAPAHPASARPHIRNAGELRRAVLLSEVLGPPRALRELDTP